MKKTILILLILQTFLGEIYSQQCLSGGCTSFVNPYPSSGAPYTPPTSWQVLVNPATGNAALMSGGNYTLFAVTVGNTYEWSYCETYGGESTSWDAQLTLFNNTNLSTPLCFSTDVCGTNTKAPYLSWTASFSGTVRLLTTVYTGISCQSNTGSLYNKLAYRQSTSASTCSGAPSFQLMSAISYSPNPIASGSYGTYSVTVKNTGTSNGVFDFELDLYDASGYVYPLGKLCGFTIVPNGNTALTFNSSTLDSHTLPVCLNPPYSVRLSAICDNCFSCGNSGCSFGVVSPGSFSNPVSINVSGSGLPSAPTGLTATVISNSQINLTWNSVAGATDYEVDYGIGSCPWGSGGNNLVTTHCNTCTTASAAGLIPNTTYRFIVVANNSCGWGTSYSCVSATTSVGCSYSISPTSVSPTSSAGSGSISVNTSSGCNWTAISNNTGWLTITSGSSGSGNGTVNYSYTANSTTSTRTGTLTIAGLTFTVTQTGIGCSFSISPSSASPSSSSGNGSVTVTSPSGCNWSAVSNNPSWLTVTSGSTGTGNGTTNYTYTANPLSTTRTGTISIAGYTFTVIQAGTSPQSSISINSSVIPPWQRENDTYQGSLTVATANPSGASWHLQVKVYNSVSGNLIATINYPSITTGTQYFFSNDPQLNAYSTEGNEMRYFAVLDANGSMAQAGTTNIIEKKWDKKNIVYYNHGNESLKIPVKYDPDYPYNSNLGIQFKRINKVSYTMVPGLTCLLLNEPYAILPPTYPVLNSFFKMENGYMTLDRDAIHSNLQDVLPGEFEYQIVKHISPSSYSVLETGEFDLTKFGKISLTPNFSGKLLIMVGGIFNEMESSVKDLQINASDASTNPNSEFSYSVIEYARQSAVSKDYSTWYIAQGNANSIFRNGYDLGITLKEIVKEYELTSGVTVSEINILCHSKGGLDTRSMLSGHNYSFDSFSQFNLNTSEQYLKSKISKVLFFDTPHFGANLAAIATHWCSFGLLSSIPGVSDLIPFNQHLNIINSIPMPTNIYFLNMTGYRDYSTMSDQVVKVSESQNPQLFTNKIIQLYQNDAREDCASSFPPCNIFPHKFWDLFHMQVHKNIFLNHNGNDHYASLNCNTGFNNLQKICFFLDDAYPNPLLVSCTNSPIFLYGHTIGSTLSGADIFYKHLEDTSYAQIGKTDENGDMNVEIFGGMNMNDSIKISASGKQTLTFPIDSTIISTHTFNVVMLKSTSSFFDVQYPSIKLVAEKPIVDDQYIEINISAINASSFEINSPLNQDSIFVSIDPGVSVLQLDTGMNHIIVHFIGTNVLTQTKDAYYFPDSLLNSFAQNITINADSSSFGCKVNIDGFFYREIDSASIHLKVLKGAQNFKFSKYGYQSSIYQLDSSRIINVQLSPVSYSSHTESTLHSLSNDGSPKYWKNITLRNEDTSSIANVSIKQFDDIFSGMGLIPKTRKFEFINVSNPLWSKIRFTSVLDQIENLSEDSVYLMRIYDDTLFTKIEFDTTNVAGYDSLVQKLTYNYINFKNGAATKEALVIMKKQAPLVNSVPNFNINVNDTLTLALSQFFSDPDSLHNDMTTEVLNSSPQLNFNIIGDSILISAIPCWGGIRTLNLKATHDGLTRNNAITINVLGAPSPEINVNGSTVFCEGDSVSLTSSVLGNSYLWSTGDTSSTIFAKATGNYSLIVTDINSCASSTTPINIAVNPLPAPIINSLNSFEACQGSFISMEVSNFNSYLWSNGATTQALLTTIPGIYSVTVTDGNGCSALSLPVNAIIHSLPIVTTYPNGNFKACEGDTIILSAIPNDFSHYLYLWNNSTTFVENLALSTGSYNVTLTDTNGCFGISPDVDIVFNPKPPANISSSGTLDACPGENLTFTVFTSNSFLWSNGDTSNTSIVVTTPGDYFAIVTDTNGCSSKSQVVHLNYFDEPLPPTITASGSTTFCLGDSVQLHASFILPLEWNTGETEEDIKIKTAGNYFISGVNFDGCSVRSDTIRVIVNSLPTVIANASDTNVCSGTNLVLYGSGANTYFWTNGVLDSVFFIPNATQSYVVIGTDLNNCKNIDSIIVSVSSQTVASTISAQGPTSFCQGESVTLSGNNGGQWSNGETSATIVVMDIGTYYVVNSNACNSDTSNSIFVNVDPSVPTSISAMTNSLNICSGTPVTFIANAVNPGNAPYFQWLVNNVPVGLGFDSLTINNLSDNDMVRVILVSSEPCASPDSAYSNNLMMSVSPPPLASVINANGSANICEGSSLILSGNSGGIWNTGDLAGSITTSIGGIYYVTNQNSCDTAISNTISVSVNTMPDTSITIKNDTLISNAIGTKYQWIYCNGAPTALEDTTRSFIVTTNGSYAVVVKQNNCVDTSNCYPIVVTGLNNNKSISIFNAFPNPANDLLNISASNLANSVYKITIKSILGQTIFEDKLKVENGILNTQIKMKNYPTGIYFISIESILNRNVIKIVKW